MELPLAKGTVVGSSGGVRRIAPHRTCSPLAAAQRQQLEQNLVVGDVHCPALRGSHGGVKSLVRIGEPSWAGVVEVRQHELFERFRRVLVAQDRLLGVAEDRLVDPLDTFRRVEPPVAPFGQPSGFQGFRFDEPVIPGFPDKNSGTIRNVLCYNDLDGPRGVRGFHLGGASRFFWRPPCPCPPTVLPPWLTASATMT